jgi:predicted molibdopterin-dependent oxidoreductase YjgC
MSMRIRVHPILGEEKNEEFINIQFDGRWIRAKKGEMILAALLAEGIIINRFTERYKEPRGLFCGIGLCTDCSMVVNGRPNVRTCITPVAEGMVVHTQYGNREERITENGD